MKNVLITLLAIGCAAILVMGNLHWKEKTTVTTAVESRKTVSDNSEVTPVKPDVDPEEVEMLTENWPTEAREQYSKALEEKRPFTILLAGSNALGTEPNGWGSLVKKELENKFKGTVKVVIKSYDFTSDEFITEEKLEELVEEKPDLTLLEPFTLEDNGEVEIEDSHRNISKIAAGLLEENPEHVFILQPPFPIYQATYYPIQVDSLKDYAKRNSIPFLDHWTAWPNPDSEEIKQYLTENQESPNEEGHKLWAEFLSEYFIAE